MNTPDFLIPKKPIPVTVILTGIVCITALEITAMCFGYNGTMLKAVIAVIAIAIGIVIPTPKLK